MLSASLNFSDGTSMMDVTNSVASQMKSGDFSINPVNIINSLINSFTQEFKELSYYIIVFFCIGMLTTILNLMGREFKSGSGEMAFFVCYSAAAATAVKCFTVCLEFSSNVVGNITDFITKLTPLLMTLIITTGKAVSVAAFNPVLSSAIYILSLICNKCILPLASYSVILTIADNIGDNVRISGLCKMMNSSAKWILALSFTLFTGICAIYGFAAPSLDAVSAKTVKFAVGSLVPVVGGFLSETLETVITSGKLMKNSIGAAGMVVMCIICITPILKIATMALIVKISAIVVEPISDRRISMLLSGISSAITVLFAMVATVSVLFVICIGIILAATG